MKIRFKPPETELDYYKIRCAMIGQLKKSKKELRDKTTIFISETKELVLDLTEKIKKITLEICRIYNVNHPNTEQPDPEKITFHEWSKRMEGLIQQEKIDLDVLKEIEEKQKFKIYEKLICMHCPFKDSFENFDGKFYPCKATKTQKKFPITNPESCGMIISGLWNQNELIQEIFCHGGEQALTNFMCNQQKLK